MALSGSRMGPGRGLVLVLALLSMLLAPSAALPSLRGGAGGLPEAGTLRLRGGFLKRLARHIPFPRFIQREYEFSPAEEAAFRATGLLMNHVSIGFFFHAMFQSTMVVREVAHNGPPALLGFLDCADEMTYAWLIRAASSAFTKIADTEGNDLGHLMNAVDLQNRLWKKMRVPLMVKTMILFVGMLWSLFGEQIDASYGDTLREKMKGVAGTFARSMLVGMVKDMRRSFGEAIKEFRSNVGKPFRPVGIIFDQAKANFKRNMLNQIDKARQAVSGIRTDRKPSTSSRKINQEDPKGKKQEKAKAPKEEPRAKKQEKATAPKEEPKAKKQEKAAAPKEEPKAQKQEKAAAPKEEGKKQTQPEPQQKPAPPPPAQAEAGTIDSKVEEMDSSDFDTKLEEIGRGV